MSNVSDRLDIELRAVVYREGNWSIAHCLELDIVAEGKTPQSALRDLLDLCDAQIEAAERAGNIEDVFRAAPAKYWKLYAVAAEIKLPRKSKKPIHRFTARRLTFD